MLVGRRSAGKISKIVEKRLRQEYRSNVYFYIESIELQLSDGVGNDTITCVAGYEKYHEGQPTGKFHQVRFKFTTPGVVRSIKEFAAVLATYSISALDEFDYFERE